MARLDDVLFSAAVRFLAPDHPGHSVPPQTSDELSDALELAWAEPDVLAAASDAGVEPQDAGVTADAHTALWDDYGGAE